MATVPGAMLLCASSPYAKRGVLWDAYRRHFGKDGPVLVWKADTRSMNPTVPQSVVDEAAEADPASAAAEYGAEFRADIGAFITREIVDAVTAPGRYELPPMSGISAAAFCDPSGGASDSFTLAIAHRDRDTDRGVLDVLRERRPPFSPDDVVAEFAALLKDYGVREVEGDKYGGEWVAERFREHGIAYKAAEKPKSDIYREALPLLNAGRVELVDSARLAAQLCGLERRTARSGRDSIDHAAGAHDDVANAACGALVRVAGRLTGLELWAKLGRDGRPPSPPAAAPQPAEAPAAREARIRDEERQKLLAELGATDGRPN
jgi:hypothetical protein